MLIRIIGIVFRWSLRVCVTRLLHPIVQKGKSVAQNTPPAGNILRKIKAQSHIGYLPLFRKIPVHRETEPAAAGSRQLESWQLIRWN
jgi:hypothetical protein